jgi:predicted urease superfamily metal-dependent hydrolase
MQLTEEQLEQMYQAYVVAAKAYEEVNAAEALIAGIVHSVVIDKSKDYDDACEKVDIFLHEDRYLRDPLCAGVVMEKEELEKMWEEFLEEIE